MTLSLSDSFYHYFFLVKVLLVPEGHMMTVAFTIGLTTQDLKNHFANELRVPSDFIQITLNGDHTLLVL